MTDLSEVLNVRMLPTLARGVRLTAIACGMGQSEFIREALREKIERAITSPLVSADNRETIILEMQRPEAVASAFNEARRMGAGEMARVEGVQL